MPGDVSQDRIMGLAGESYPDGSVFNAHGSLPPDKMPIDLQSVALFESSELLGQHTVEGVRHHGQQYIEVNLDQNGEDRAFRWKNLTASEMASSSTRQRRA